MKRLLPRLAGLLLALLLLSAAPLSAHAEAPSGLTEGSALSGEGTLLPIAGQSPTGNGSMLGRKIEPEEARLMLEGLDRQPLRYVVDPRDPAALVRSIGEPMIFDKDNMVSFENLGLPGIRVQLDAPTGKSGAIVLGGLQMQSLAVAGELAMSGALSLGREPVKLTITKDGLLDGLDLAGLEADLLNNLANKENEQKLAEQQLQEAGAILDQAPTQFFEEQPGESGQDPNANWNPDPDPDPEPAPEPEPQMPPVPVISGNPKVYNRENYSDGEQSPFNDTGVTPQTPSYSGDSEDGGSGPAPGPEPEGPDVPEPEGPDVPEPEGPEVPEAPLHG